MRVYDVTNKRWNCFKSQHKLGKRFVPEYQIDWQRRQASMNGIERYIME